MIAQVDTVRAGVPGEGAHAGASPVQAGGAAALEAKSAPEESAVPDALAAKALLISRAYLFTLFHKLLGGVPNEALVEELLSDVTADVVDECAQDETMRGLGAFLEELRGRDAAEFLDAARDEYTRTFLGPAQLPAPPVESPYLSHDAAAFQKNTLAVRTWYRRFGLLPKRYLREPDDHVAIMCGFMAHLAKDALEAFAANDAGALAEKLASQRSFVANHMCDWLPHYAVALRRSKTAVLYPQLVEALAAFARQDVAFMASAEEWLGHVEGDAFAGASREPSAFVQTCAALERIGALRPFGIEDNELAPENEVPGHDAPQAASRLGA